MLANHPYGPFVFICFLLGFGVKAGIFPVHIWLPDAHPIAPSPASALLSGVMIKAGGYGIIRTIYTIMGVGGVRHEWIAYVVLGIAFINIFLGSAMAIKQTEIKRMLAYSSVSQIGYVLLGVILMTPLGLVGGVVHIFNHAIMKVTLFLCAGAFIHQTGLRKLDDLRGIGKRMPLTTLCFTLAGFSMIGFPPFVGFISKWFLVLGSLQVAKSGSYGMKVGVATLCLLILSSLMNLMYYGPIIYRAWFPGDEDDAHGGAYNTGAVACKTTNDDPDNYMMVPLLILGAALVILGLFPQLGTGLANQFSQLYFH